MPHLRALGVNDAFRMLVEEFAKDPLLEEGEIAKCKNSSRVGNVIQAVEPVIVTYLNPTHRVLFNQARDANPFFHLMESLWMLAGRDNVTPMAYYSSKIADIASDDGVSFNGAYGFRWRHSTSGTRHIDESVNVDQLEIIINQLKSKPTDRRCVLQMWNVEDDLLKINSTKDVCCNTNAYFLINNNRLDMTVCNRSNDLILGMLGANVVHFSFLLEYMAAHIGVEVGVYNQVTNNLHVYESNFKPEEWLEDATPNYYNRLPRINGVKLVKDPKQFDRELKIFNEEWLGLDLSESWVATFKEPFFQTVAMPMALAFVYHKRREYKKANQYCSEILADDWRIACTNWVRKREARYNRASNDGVDYEDNRNPYLENHLRRDAEDVST